MIATPLHQLSIGLSGTGCFLHACERMTNHVHLLVTPPEAGAVARLMISLGRRYVQYINPSYRCIGKLWDSRYKGVAGGRRHVSVVLSALR
jgi:putative transposase